MRQKLSLPVSNTVLASLFTLACVSVGCSAGTSQQPGSGGSTANGGVNSNASGGANTNGGAAANGGNASGGANANGGAPANGGANSNGGAPANGGSGNGGNNAAGGNGNASAGGNATGGNATGGSAAGGNAGNASGGASTAGASSGGGSGGGCKASGLLFCDDFETGTTAGMAPLSPWKLTLNGSGKVEIDATTAANSGSKSVHVSSNGAYQAFFTLTGTPVFPAAQGSLYLRLYIRLGAPMTGGHNTYYKAGAAGASSSEHETRVGVMNSMLMINQPAGDRGFLSNQNYYNDGMKPGVVFAEKTWTCVEALFDPPHSTFQIWVNGKDVPDLHRTDWQQDALGAFHFGFEKYAGPDADIWYDDIAVSAQPIGCQ